MLTRVTLTGADDHEAQSLGSASASLLFDPSGGRGIEPFRWPSTPLGVRMGFAGGINPHNVLGVLDDIGLRPDPFWIDMESGVRDTNDRFDLGRVRAVLEAAAPFVSHAADP